MYYSKESEAGGEINTNNFNNEGNEQHIIYVDAAEMVSNDGNVLTFDGGNNCDNGDANDLLENNKNDEVENSNDIVEVDNSDDLTKHNLILRETIDENGHLVKGYFCQQCNLAFNTIDDFLAYHPSIEGTFDENEQMHTTTTGDKLWDLVENLDEIEEDHNESSIVEMKPNTNGVDVDDERYFCCHCQQVFKDLDTAETHNCSNELQNTENVEEVDYIFDLYQKVTVIFEHLFLVIDVGKH